MRTRNSDRMGRMVALGGMLALSIVAASSDAVAGGAASAMRRASVNVAAIDARSAAAETQSFGDMGGTVLRRRIIEVQPAPSLGGVSSETLRSRWVVPMPIPALAAQVLLDGGVRRRLLVALVGAGD